MQAEFPPQRRVGRPGITVLGVVGAAGVCRPLAEALAAESDGGIRLHEAIGAAAAIERLGQEPVDALLVVTGAGRAGDRGLDALELTRALRTAGHREPVVVLLDDASADHEADCYEAGADACCRLSATTPRLLSVLLRRAVEQTRIALEHDRLAEAERRRLSKEHHEAVRLLTEQRRIVTQLEALRDPRANPLVLPPTEVTEQRPGSTEKTDAGSLANRYRELVQTYAMMDTAGFAGELAAIANELTGSGATGRQAIELHVEAVERVVAGLGTRGSRHVLDRAELLALEMLANLADGYRERYHAMLPRRGHPGRAPGPAVPPDRQAG